ncbi:hypothetical protein AX774_g1913 [Zancudomyces culisetae]|uniref:Uncharacterized protein n=1 Tax=Zancudomyces culisetae TaxID=1213189 RepID=A0A1R1PEI9_ZANCU|nr:hypothetical protein AX774_g7174 [Zancudomyces culisetae]OMH84556.1 hypothetical protein AX774_g1913 [Zancudomyces culisetae]|eukprot:OMH79410.1 hypothetical protein AX774_g7174 [Zancudomyces culisetae]
MDNQKQNSRQQLVTRSPIELPKPRIVSPSSDSEIDSFSSISTTWLPSILSARSDGDVARNSRVCTARSSFDAKLSALFTLRSSCALPTLPSSIPRSILSSRIRAPRLTLRLSETTLNTSHTSSSPKSRSQYFVSGSSDNTGTVIVDKNTGIVKYIFAILPITPCSL